MSEKASNFFEAERRIFQPTLPDMFKEINLLDVFEGERLPSLNAIQNLFPHICDQSIVHFQSNKNKKYDPICVGVVLSGGQAAGGHNVIVGLFDALKKMHPLSRLFGFLAGPAGILENKYKELDKEELDKYKNTGGFDLICSGRAKIETSDQLNLALKNCTNLNLDGLVVIGGDDSNTNAAILAEFFVTHACKTCVIGVPKTIDGDLKNEYVATSFGFDTACKIYAEMIGNICRDALSAKKYVHFIKLMGRSASHIALECALQTHPNLTLIGEEIAFKNMTLKQVTDMICDCLVERSVNGKNYGVILIPEGLIEFIPEMQHLIHELNGLMVQNPENLIEKLSPDAAATFTYLPKEIAEQLLLDRDPHGNVQVSQIATEQLLIHTVKNTLKNNPDLKGKFFPVGHFFGYEGRCGYPSNFDANYCYALGSTAAVLVGNKITGYMSTVHKLTEPVEHWDALGLPLTPMMDIEKRKGKLKPVIKKALVNLNDEPFKQFASCRQDWALNDQYRFPGPIQFFGPSEICNETTFTLKLEQTVRISLS